jgi:hypothetical protein
VASIISGDALDPYSRKLVFGLSDTDGDYGLVGIAATPALQRSRAVSAVVGARH